MAAPPSVQEAGAFLPQLAIYAAKGPPDSCGPGCRSLDRHRRENRARCRSAGRAFLPRAEGHPAADLFQFTRRRDARTRSAIGRLLRGRKVIGRVGRTVVDACPGTQTDDACSLIKTTRDEVVASLTTHGAVCGSACTFLLFGAVTREVAPDAAVAVHGPKVWMEFRLNVNEKRREEAIAKAHGEAERLAYAYVEEMGISRELIALAVSISHKKPPGPDAAGIVPLPDRHQGFCRVGLDVGKSAASLRPQDGAGQDQRWLSKAGVAASLRKQHARATGVR